MIRPYLFLGFLALCLDPLGAEDHHQEATLPDSIREFFEVNCYDCHDADLAKGELDDR